MNSKMTTNSELSTTETKNKTKQNKTKQTTRTETESQKWRSHEGYQQEGRVGRMVEKVLAIRSINLR